MPAKEDSLANKISEHAWENEHPMVWNDARAIDQADNAKYAV